MKNVIIFLLLIVANSYDTTGQGRVIKGRVALQDSRGLYTNSYVKIWTKDSVLLGKTDDEGKFTIVLPQKAQIILFLGLGMEWASIELTDSCDLVEIVLLPMYRFHRISIAKTNRLRRKKFDKLPKLHAEGVANGLFTQQHICYARRFEPYIRIKK